MALLEKCKGQVPCTPISRGPSVQACLFPVTCHSEPCSLSLAKTGGAVSWSLALWWQGGLGFPLTLSLLSQLFYTCCDITATRAVRGTMGSGGFLGLKEGWVGGWGDACRGMKAAQEFPETREETCWK